MNVVDLIRKKRDGNGLETDEINFLISAGTPEKTKSLITSSPLFLWQLF